MLTSQLRLRVILLSSMLAAVIFFICGSLLVVQASESTMNTTPSKLKLSYVRQFNLGFKYADTDDFRVWVAGLATTAQRLVAYNPKVHQFWVFDLSGRKVASFGNEGMRPGEFMTPTGVAFDQNSNMLVADEGIPVIRRYRLNGQYIDDATQTVTGITGWSDVAWSNGVLVGSPSTFDSFRNKKGVYIFSKGKPRELCQQCFGSIALGADNLVYLVDEMTPPKEFVLPHLLVVNQTGKVQLRTAFPATGIIHDLQYWPEAGGFIVSYYGRVNVLLIRPGGKQVESLLDINNKTIVTLLPYHNELYIVSSDGKVTVYKLQTAK